MAPLVVVVPVFNEGRNLPAWWDAARVVLPPSSVVRVVYDFDEDDTVPVAARLARDGAPLELLRSRGRGARAAVITGLRSVTSGPVVVSMADLSDDLATLPAMLEAYRQGASVVVSSRYMPGGRQLGGPWLKRQLSRYGGLSLYHLAGFPVRDATNSFRLYDGAFVAATDVGDEGGFEVGFELALRAWMSGARVVEVPGTWRDRVTGESRFAMRRWLPRYGRLWLRAMWFGATGR